MSVDNRPKKKIRVLSLFDGICTGMICLHLWNVTVYELWILDYRGCSISIFLVKKFILSMAVWCRTNE